MDQTTNSTSTSTSTAASSTSSSSTTILRALNKSSFKISKPIPRNPARPSSPPPTNTDTTAAAQPQPPVYNIDKTNFRDVVQKLTGSPAHPAMPPPPPPPTATHPRPPSSRLHRIRPPPLAPLPPPQPSAVPTGGTWMRPPFSPLPPFPTVSAAAESPITAYLRRLHAGPLLSPQGMGQPQSPLGFGCVPSPRMVFPRSPGLQMPSPK